MDTRNAFARHTMAERIPAILRDVLASNPDYPAPIQSAVDQLGQSLLNDAPIPMLADEPAPPADYEAWAAAYRAQRARFEPLTWQHTEWFFAEMFLYRHLIQAVRWAETGRDPFAPQKQAELNGERLWTALDRILAFEGSDRERLANLLLSAVWGNQADLSHAVGQGAGAKTSDDDLLIDERDAAVAILLDAPPLPGRPVHLVLDNAGLELAADLALADALIAAGHRVVLHAKAYPVFVSDTTIPDIWRTLEALDRCEGRPRALAQRLRQAWAAERLRLTAPPLWTSSRFLWDMPPALRRVMGRARAVIFKGDANYRRVVGDALWEEGVSFAEAVRYFPAPLVALRSLKSDALVGLDPGRGRALDAQGAGWRTSGRYGVIQVAGGPTHDTPPGP